MICCNVIHWNALRQPHDFLETVSSTYAMNNRINVAVKLKIIPSVRSESACWTSTNSIFTAIIAHSITRLLWAMLLSGVNEIFFGWKRIKGNVLGAFYCQCDYMSLEGFLWKSFMTVTDNHSSCFYDKMFHLSSSVCEHRERFWMTSDVSMESFKTSRNIFR